MNENETGATKLLALKVIGLVVSIIAGIIVLALIFSFTIMPVYKYNNALKCAEDGRYEEAVAGLVMNKYKDSEQKCSEYALIAGEKYYEQHDMDKAIDYYSIALNKSENNIEAFVYLYDLGAVEYIEDICTAVLSEGDEIYNNGDISKAAVFYKYVSNSSDESLRNSAEQKLEEINN